MKRCAWCGQDPLYTAYHDEEWGRPVWDGRALWEVFFLETFQAGLSWITILRKREGFRAAFASFDPDIIANYGAEDVARLMQDPAIVRHRGKIEASISNAQAYLALEASGGFAPFVWSVVGGVPRQNLPRDFSQVPAVTPEAEALAKALRQRGFRFCGPTTCYAFMQAAGLVNDHVADCGVAAEVAQLGQRAGG